MLNQTKPLQYLLHEFGELFGAVHRNPLVYLLREWLELLCELHESVRLPAGERERRHAGVLVEKLRT